MTRESEKSKIRMSIVVDSKHINSLKKADEVIDQIFDEHEAQLKAKENDLERQDMIIKCLNIDLDNKEKLLKDKEEDLKLALDELTIERGIKEYLANEWRSKYV